MRPEVRDWNLVSSAQHTTKMLLDRMFQFLPLRADSTIRQVVG